MKHKVTIELLVDADAPPPTIANTFKQLIESGNAFSLVGLEITSTAAVTVEPYDAPPAPTRNPENARNEAYRVARELTTNPQAFIHASERNVVRRLVSSILPDGEAGYWRLVVAELRS